jgi:hypothetical protein
VVVKRSPPERLFRRVWQGQDAAKFGERDFGLVGQGRDQVACLLLFHVLDLVDEVLEVVGLDNLARACARPGGPGGYRARSPRGKGLHGALFFTQGLGFLARAARPGPKFLLFSHMRK